MSNRPAPTATTATVESPGADVSKPRSRSEPRSPPRDLPLLVQRREPPNLHERSRTTHKAQAAGGGAPLAPRRKPERRHSRSPPHRTRSGSESASRLVSRREPGGGLSTPLRIR